MKSCIKIFAVLFAAFLFFGPHPKLEAKHHKHFSFNVGTYFPAYPVGYVVAPPQPSYVERHVYVNPYGYPMQESVYVHPRPYYQPTYVCPPPAVTGLSFGVRFR